MTHLLWLQVPQEEQQQWPVGAQGRGTFSQLDLCSKGLFCVCVTVTERHWACKAGSKRC